jgi:hypothetical protein
LRSAFWLSLVLGVCGKASGHLQTRAAAAAPEGDVPSYAVSAPGAETPSWLELFSFAELDVQYGELFASGFVKRTGGGTRARLLAVAVTLNHNR